MRTNEFEQPIGEPVPDWAGAAVPQPVTLEGQRVRLEPVEARHAEQILARLTEPSLWTYRPDLPPRTLEAARTLAVGWQENPAATTFVIVPVDHTGADNGLEGLASLMRCDPAQGSVEVGAILYARSLQGTRAATEAMHLLASYVFYDLGYRRYEWKCDSLNQPSRRAASRLGFSYEGRFRNALVYKNRNRDTDWFSITAEEWPQVADIQRRWLADANFDDNGKQRQSLSLLMGERRSSVAQ